MITTIDNEGPIEPISDEIFKLVSILYPKYYFCVMELPQTVFVYKTNDKTQQCNIYCKKNFGNLKSDITCFVRETVSGFVSYTQEGNKSITTNSDKRKKKEKKIIKRKNMDKIESEVSSFLKNDDDDDDDGVPILKSKSVQIKDFKRGNTYSPGTMKRPLPKICKKNNLEKVVFLIVIVIVV